MSERMTCVFDMDVRTFPSNPLHADTPFGRAAIVSRGDLAAEYDALEEKINAKDAEISELRAKVAGLEGRLEGARDVVKGRKP